MYESPIKMIMAETEHMMEDEVFKAIQRCAVDVDKEELLKALQYDRDQYNKGYQDGLNADKWIPIGQYPTEPCLLCFESGHMVVGYYHMEYEEWRVLTMDGYETDMTDEDLADGEPIAWMELPPRYKEAEQE